MLNIKFMGDGEVFNSCVADISPVKLSKIWGRRLGITDCSIISY